MTIDFIVEFPRTQKGHDSIWVIMDQLTKSAQFLPIKRTYTLDKYDQPYVDKIVWLHDVPISIILDRDPKAST